MQLKLDKIDIRILAALEEEARLQNQQLAERVCLSPGACSQRLKRLEKSKLIAGYHARIDTRRLFSAISIFAVIKLSEQGSLKQVQFLKELEKIPEVVDCFEVAGDADFIVRFDCSSLECYHDHVTALLSDPRIGIRKIESHIMLRHVRSLQRSNLLELAKGSNLIDD